LKLRQIGCMDITGPWPLQIIVQDVTGACSPIVNILRYIEKYMFLQE